jgi:hypothetical protein
MCRIRKTCPPASAAKGGLRREGMPPDAKYWRAPGIFAAKILTLRRRKSGL